MKELFALAIAGAAAAYSPSEALTGWQLVNAAYCATNEIQAWSCPNCKKSGLSLTNVVVTDGGGGRCYSAYNPAANQIIGTFRGSDDLEDWIHDIDTVKTAYPYCSSTNCMVHKGFYQAYLFLVNGFRDSIKNLRAKFPSASVRIYGHSLGGAEAVHASADLHVNLGITPEFVYTFGEPRVGDDPFRTWYGSVIPNHYRVVHDRDIVPHLPPQEMGFHHTTVEIFYPGDPPNYKICDNSGEDPTCSDQFKTYSIQDHLTYMGGSCCCTARILEGLPKEIDYPVMLPANKTVKSVCDGATDCGRCLNTTVVGVPACDWCPFQEACHDVGSVYNPCPSSVCVTRNPVSTCKVHNCTGGSD